MRTTEAEIAALVEAARATARAEILPRFRNLGAGEVDSKSAPDDLVTVADKASEAALTAAVRRIMPDAAVVGEEAVSEDRALLGLIDTSARAVLIDPIDGTWNYANGLTMFGVILAVIEDQQTTVGLLYDPVRDDWIIARKGGGTRYCRPGSPDRLLAVGQAPDRLEETTGFAALYLFHGPARGAVAAALPQFRRTNSLRCACHEYRTMAQGFVDFSLNGTLNPWDHAAGVLAVEEAGGTARLLSGRAYAPTVSEGRVLLAKSPALWDSLAAAFDGADG